MSNDPEFLVDFFFVAGLDPARGLNPFPDLSYNQAAAFDDDEESLFSSGGLPRPDKPPLQRAYQPAELCHFPVESTKSVPDFDAGSATLMALPHGMRFHTQRQLDSVDGDADVRHFAITRADGTRVNGVALVFPVSVEDAAICDAFVHLERMFAIESGVQEGEYRRDADRLLCDRVVGLLTRQPFLHCLERWLWDLWTRLQAGPAPGVSLEALVFNLLFEVPLPAPGASLHFDSAVQRRACLLLRPHDAELPPFELPLREALTLLGVEVALRLFTCLLLECRVVLHSRHQRALTVVAECLTAGLLFPFAWPHVFIPVLPANLLHYLDAPVIYLIGVLRSHESPLPPAVGPGTVVVDIDAKTISVPEDVPAFPDASTLMQELTDVLMASSPAPRRPPAALQLLLPSRSAAAEKEVLQRVGQLALKSGLSVESLQGHAGQSWSCREYAEMLTFNKAVREVFLNHLVHILNNYELFVVKPKSLATMDPVQSFDKTAFLADQCKSRLSFLSPFLETQMFTNFIDAKILATFEVRQPRPSLFDVRVQEAATELLSSANQHDLYSRAYRRINVQGRGDAGLERKIQQASVTAVSPHALPGDVETRDVALLDPRHLTARPHDAANSEPRSNQRDSVARHRRRERFLQARNLLRLSESGRGEKSGLRRPSTAGDTMPLTNCNIIDSLLNDVKSKTKRMVVEKMGHEAFALGHQSLSLSGVEENTLIAGLCDLLERIWSHGVAGRKSKSALWQHLVRFYECKTGRPPPGPASEHDGRFGDGWSKSAATTPTTPTVHRHVRRKSDTLAPPTALTPADSGVTSFRAKMQLMFRRDLNSSLKRSVKGSRHVSPLDAFCADPGLEGSIGTAEPLLNDVRSIRRMEDIHSELGYARAFVRLALEKKVLSAHLKLLLTGSQVSQQLLSDMYKTWAFLRSSDEREQLLFHLLSLNAVDYFAFTNTFNKTRVLYRVLIYTGKRLGGHNTSANAWLLISGNHATTARLAIPHGQSCMEFEHANLGCLSMLHLGHDNSGISPKWYVEAVYVQNTITNHIYRFPCGRWLGRDVDDGSLQRMLIAQLLQTPAHAGGGVREARLSASGGATGVSDWTLGRRRSVTSGPGAALLAAAGSGSGRRSGGGYASMPSSPTASLRRRRQASVERDGSMHSSFSASGHHLASSASDLELAGLQEALREAMNRLIKHLNKPEHEQGSLTVLLLDTSDNALVPTLQGILSYGFRASRGLFARQMYVWDYLERVAKSFEDEWVTLQQQLDPGQFALVSRFTRYISLVNQTVNADMGKDRKLQIWLCIGIRDHVLQRWLPLLATEACALTRQHYDENSFLRDADKRGFLCDVMASLDGYRMYLEPVLVGNIDP